LAALPNSLIIDLEDGAENYECASINVRAICLKEDKTPLTVLGEVTQALKKSYQDGFRYDYIIIDTTTALEAIARDYATTLYKKTLMGNKFKGTDVVSELPNGQGYDFLRKAFEKIYNQFVGLASKCLILSGHVKNASINKEGKDLQARDIQLTGKLKTIVCQDADAIGYLYRDGNSTRNILSFKTLEQDLATGARPFYLSGEDFIISKKIENGTIKTNWELIFPSIKN